MKERGDLCGWLAVVDAVLRTVQTERGSGALRRGRTAYGGYVTAGNRRGWLSAASHGGRGWRGRGQTGQTPTHRGWCARRHLHRWTAGWRFERHWCCGSRTCCDPSLVVDAARARNHFWWNRRRGGFISLCWSGSDAPSGADAVTVRLPVVAAVRHFPQRVLLGWETSLSVGGQSAALFTHCSVERFCVRRRAGRDAGRNLLTQVRRVYVPSWRRMQVRHTHTRGWQLLQCKRISHHRRGQVYAESRFAPGSRTVRWEWRVPCHNDHDNRNTTLTPWTRPLFSRGSKKVHAKSFHKWEPDFQIISFRQLGRLFKAKKMLCLPVCSYALVKAEVPLCWMLLYLFLKQPWAHFNLLHSVCWQAELKLLTLDT